MSCTVSKDESEIHQTLTNIKKHVVLFLLFSALFLANIPPEISKTACEKKLGKFMLYPVVSVVEFMMQVD